MEFTLTYVVSASSYFRGECDYDFSEEGADRDAPLRKVLAEIVDNDYPLPDELSISTYKSITLETERGPELFKSEPVNVENYGHAHVEAFPLYIELKAARERAKLAAKQAETLAAEENAKAARMRIYESVKAELEAKGTGS